MAQAISPKQAQELIQGGSVEVIDVRDDAEWLGGHIAGARHVPLATFRSDPKAALGHDGIVFVCAAGVRSETAARLAQSTGYKRVYNLSGGTRAWQRAGLPLEYQVAAPAAE